MADLPVTNLYLPAGQENIDNIPEAIEGEVMNYDQPLCVRDYIAYIKRITEPKKKVKIIK